MNDLNIENSILQARKKINKIHQLHNELAQLFQPILDNIDDMTEEQIGKILKQTNDYQTGFHITLREYARRKFGP